MPTSAFSARHRGSSGLLYPRSSVGTHYCVLDVNFRIEFVNSGAKLLKICGISAELQQINATGFDN